MIKASELRKGNIIGWRTGFGELITGTVYEVHAGKVAIGPETIIDDNSSGQSFMTLNGIEPIPLTREWLERCGFKNEDGSTLWDNGIIAIFDYNENNVYSFHYQSKKAQVQYLHQLQNLYLALSGEELTVKQ